jgi:hypothetical protein
MDTKLTEDQIIEQVATAAAHMEIGKPGEVFAKETAPKQISRVVIDFLCDNQGIPPADFLVLVQVAAYLLVHDFKKDPDMALYGLEGRA